MIDLKLSEIATAVNGTLSLEDRTVGAVSTDSRKIPEGALFVALRGEKFDAHDFIPAAVDGGAGALMVSADPLPGKNGAVVPWIRVPDTRLALGQLGALVARRTAPRTVSVTGTCGKTSVKEMLSAILSLDGPTLATRGNFNNDIGVPLTLLELTSDHRYAVVEMGTNHPGEIAYTASLLQSDVCAVNNIGYAHIEGFGSLRGVYQAKKEIFAGLREGGTAVFPRDSEFYEDFCRDVSNRRLSFGSTPEADIHPLNVTADEGGCCSFELSLSGTVVPVKLQIPGRHSVLNACCAAACALALGIGPDLIARGLGSCRSFKGRLHAETIGHVTLIDDAYNAAANAVFAAIDTLSSMRGRRILVLGEMGELGSMAEELHREVGRRFRASGIEHLLTLGDLTRWTVQEAGERGEFLSSRQDLYNTLRKYMPSGEPVTVLVKGAHYMRMNEVAEFIKENLC